MSATDLATLLQQIRSCDLCAPHLADGVRPVLQASSKARILIAGQAPGRKVHASGVPFDDASGERLRDWMGISRETFYDPDCIAILPMGFCYPGTGRSGDLPPRSECAATWRSTLLAQLPALKMQLIIGQYAMDYHLPNPRGTLTQTVEQWRVYAPARWPLPHPSPRNNIWLKKNPWFADDVLPALRQRVSAVLQ